MNSLRLNRHPDSFGTAMGYSMAAHAALFILFFVRAAFFPSEPILVRHAIRVDVVGLPDKMKPDQVPAPAAAKATPPPAQAAQLKSPTKTAKAPPAPQKVDLTKTKESQRQALERLKAMDAIEKIKGEVAKAPNESSSQAAATTFKGNALSSGDSLSGLEAIEFDRYFSGIEGKIRQNWSLPGWLANAPLKAQALVRIDAQGAVIRRELVQSSGNQVFDDRVMEAIDQSAPFPAPPARLKDVLALKGIIFNFPE